jgi:endonuclease YncB( thermonuclease family)
MKCFCTLLVLFGLLVTFAYAETVNDVHDGDTFMLINTHSIRLACIKAPVLMSPVGNQSRSFLKSLIGFNAVTLHCVDQSAEPQICFATVNGRDVGEQMVQAGLAYPSLKAPYCTNYQERLNQAEQQAKESYYGLWREHP